MQKIKKFYRSRHASFLSALKQKKEAKKEQEQQVQDKRDDLKKKLRQDVVGNVQSKFLQEVVATKPIKEEPSSASVKPPIYKSHTITDFKKRVAGASGDD